MLNVHDWQAASVKSEDEEEEDLILLIHFES